MELASTKTIKNLLRNYGIFPSKRLGQNFLIDETILFKIIETACLKPKDIVLEIGPGIGNLTQEIAKKAKTVIAIEKDKQMIEILKETTKNFKNVEIIQADILKISDNQLPAINYKIVANLPYYIVSPVIRKFLEMSNPPKEMILMVQKEVAQRICPPSLKLRRAGANPKMNLLSISVQFYATPEIISFVSKKSFWPEPKVDGAILKIIPKKTLPKIKRNLFFKIVRAGFSQPRKQLANNFANVLRLDKEKIKSWLLKNNINPSQRAETLNLENWIGLTKSFVFLL